MRGRIPMRVYPITSSPSLVPRMGRIDPKRMNDSLFSKASTQSAQAPQTQPPTDALVVFEDTQAAFAAEVCTYGALTPIDVHVLGEQRTEQPALLQSATQHEDIRRAIADTEASTVLVLGAGSSTKPSIVDDLQLLSHIQERGMTSLLIPPAPVRLTELSQYSKLEVHPVQLPRVTRDPRFADLIELLEDCGEPRSMQVVLTAPLHTIPLLSLLVDACETAHRILDAPVSASAAITPESPLSSLDRPHSLTGTAHLLLRNSGGRSCSIRIADRGPFERMVRVMTSDRVITLDPTGLHVHVADGSEIDSSPGHSPSAPELCGTQIIRSFDPNAVRPEPADPRITLAIVEACLLSARTGSPESPDTMLQISGERGSA